MLAEPAADRGESQLVIRCLQLPADLSPEDRILVNTQLSFQSFIAGDLTAAQDAISTALDLAHDHPGEAALFASMIHGVQLAYLGELAASAVILRDTLRSAEQFAGPRLQAWPRTCRRSVGRAAAWKSLKPGEPT